MDRTERFYKIERMLRNRDVVPIQDFLNELSVSVATFKRDIEYLPHHLPPPLPLPFVIGVVNRKPPPEASWIY